MLKVGIIGCGSIMKGAHMRAYKKLLEENGSVIVEAYCDICADAMEGLDGRLYTNADEMLKAEQGKLDYIDICVPTYVHAEIAVKALEAGFSVLSEKPMARTIEQGRAMIDAAQRTGKLLMCAYCNRFYTGARYIRDLIRSGELGKVRSAEFHRIGGPHPTGRDNWFLQGELAGGAMLDLHIHDVDMIRWMFGMPNAVSAAAQSETDGAYDRMSVNYMYDNNVFVHADCDWIVANNKFDSRVIRVNFEKGYVYVDRSADRQAFVMVKEDGTVTDLMEKLPFDAYYNEIVYFVDCLANNKPVSECTPEDSLDSIKLIMAEMKSADLNGQRVCL